jgi:hypothetical protein
MSDQIVVRERDDYVGFSDQERFGKGNNDFYIGYYRWASSLNEEMTEVPYKADNRERDIWLQKMAKKDPILTGVLSSVVDIDKNRGWRMVGGRNQVMRFTDIFHNWQAAPGVFGWRPGISHASKSFWNTDMGAVVEIGRATRNGPVRALYSVDPTKCKLSGDDRYPLHYYQKKSGKPLKWRSNDYARTASLIDFQDEYNGLGFSAISRCLEFLRLMVAIYEHDKEMLGSKAPRGLLLLNGIAQKQYDDAMEVRAERLEGSGIDYFDAVAVLASKGTQVDAKLIALSQLPAGFNLKEWVDMVIYGYALAFGFDASEFWPVQFGALGRGTETEIQHEKATGKGRLDFVLGFQEQVQETLPDSLIYEFDQRDDKGDLIKAQVHQAQATVVKTMYESGSTSAEGSLLSRMEARTIMADYALIPRPWADIETTASTANEDEEGKIDDEDKAIEPEDTGEQTTDTIAEPKKVAEPTNGKVPAKGRSKTILRDALMDNYAIQRAALKFPKDPIVQYNYPNHTLITLWDSGEELLHRRTWQV